MKKPTQAEITQIALPIMRAEMREDRLPKVAAALEEAFGPEHVIHYDGQSVGVYSRLHDFDEASGRLGKIGICRGGVNAIGQLPK